MKLPSIIPYILNDNFVQKLQHILLTTTLGALFIFNAAHAAKAEAEKAEIVFAAIGPITGQDATTGEQMQRGTKAAIDQINSEGGILGQKIKLIIKDDACDPKQGVAIANSLGGDGVTAVIGNMCSGTAIPASKIYNEQGIFMVSPSATNPALTTQGLDNVFRVCGRDDQQGKVITDYLAKNYAQKPIAIIHDKTAYGQGLADEVRQKLRTLGQAEAFYDTINRGERDYSALISRLKQQNITVVAYGGYHTEAGLIVRQMREQGLKTILIGGEGLVTSEFWSITGKAGEGSLMSFSPDPRKIPSAAAAVNQLRQSGYEPEGYTLYSYAAAQILAEAITRAKSTDYSSIRKAMHEGAFHTVIGDIAFDQNGDVTKPDYIIYRWHDGNYSAVQ